jgi:hypothetical protein
VIDFLDAAYRDAGRPGWPESPWQSQVIERVKPTGQARSGSSTIPQFYGGFRDAGAPSDEVFPPGDDYF